MLPVYRLFERFRLTTAIELVFFLASLQGPLLAATTEMEALPRVIFRQRIFFAANF